MVHLKEPGDGLPERAVVANVRHNVQRLVEAKPILADLAATAAQGSLAARS